MEINLNQKAIDNISIALSKYNYIMDRLSQIDVSLDASFQKKYNGFYRMRQRPPEYYAIYFNFMKKHKTKDVIFEEVLRYFHSSFGRIEASFSSKLMATINPDKPVWDEFVLKNLGIIKPPTYSKNRIEKTVAVYKQIEHFYDEFLQTMECQELVNIFDMHFPNTKITKTKKVDLLLWQNRD